MQKKEPRTDASQRPTMGTVFKCPLFVLYNLLPSVFGVPFLDQFSEQFTSNSTSLLFGQEKMIIHRVKSFFY